MDPSARSFMTAASIAYGSVCICGEREPHHFHQCDKFREVKPHQRVKLVNKTRLYTNCVRRYGKDACKNGSCRVYNKPHNTLLHLPGPSDSSGQASDDAM